MDTSDHEAKEMVKYLIPWHCEFENVYCLQAAKINFDKVKNGEIDWNGINVNIRTFSLNFGLREGDQEDYNWVEDQMFSAKDQEEFEAFASGLFSNRTHVFISYIGKNFIATI